MLIAPRQAKTPVRRTTSAQARQEENESDDDAGLRHVYRRIDRQVKFISQY